MKNKDFYLNISSSFLSIFIFRNSEIWYRAEQMEKKNRKEERKTQMTENVEKKE